MVSVAVFVIEQICGLKSWLLWFKQCNSAFWKCHLIILMSAPIFDMCWFRLEEEEGEEELLSALIEQLSQFSPSLLWLFVVPRWERVAWRTLLSVFCWATSGADARELKKLESHVIWKERFRFTWGCCEVCTQAQQSPGRNTPLDRSPITHTGSIHGPRENICRLELELNWQPFISRKS